MTPLKAQAIQTALMGDWTNAILLNQHILEENPDDVDTLNRLAFAQASLGNIKEARNIYQKVLSLDTQNPIAAKNLKRLSGTAAKNGSQPAVQMNNIFIEEPGKTKVLDLMNVAEQKVISQLRCGEVLTLVVKRMKIFVLDGQKQYIGMLPDDISKRLIEFIHGGNEYEPYVKTINNHKVTIFIRETKRVARFKNQPSFASMEKSKLHITGNGKRHAKTYAQKASADERKGHSSSDDEE